MLVWLFTGFDTREINLVLSSGESYRVSGFGFLDPSVSQAYYPRMLPKPSRYSHAPPHTYTVLDRHRAVPLMLVETLPRCYTANSNFYTTCNVTIYSVTRVDTLDNRYTCRNIFSRIAPSLQLQQHSVSSMVANTH